MDTNVKGVFFLTQKLLPLLREAAARPRTRRASSTSARSTASRRRCSTTSRTGRRRRRCTHLTRLMAAQLVKQNIIVNAIAPGPFPTWMLSTGVGSGGDVEGDATGRPSAGQSARPRRHAGRHRRPRDLPRLARRRVHGRRDDHVRRRRRRGELIDSQRAPRGSHADLLSHVGGKTQKPHA